MNSKIPFSVFVIGLIAIGTLALYAPYYLEDSGWELVNTPDPNEPEDISGRVHLYKESEPAPIQIKNES